MGNKKPFSALYYMKENKGRFIICAFMMFLASLTFLAGNYIASEPYSYKKEFEYSDKLVWVCIQSTDEDFVDFKSFAEAVREDSNLDCAMHSARGFSALSKNTVLNIEMGGNNYIFNSKEDMERVFAHLGIEGDFSNCKDRSVIVSKALANNNGLKLGDKLDNVILEGMEGEYSVDAIIDDGSYCTFYIYEDIDDMLLCMYVFSESMKGKELYDYVNALAAGKNVKIGENDRDFFSREFYIFYILFYSIDILIAIVLAVTVNSVVTGQYLKRKYEFGIYKALGYSNRKLKSKIRAELFFMNFIACLLGFGIILLYTYLVNELMYKPNGMYLVYASKVGIIGFLICEIVILIPLILTNSHRMCKVDVTSF